MYAFVFSVDIHEGTSVHTPTRSTWTYAKDHTNACYFLNSNWIILGRTLQPSDHCINSTRHILGLANVRYFSQELVAPLSYKNPLPLSFSHALSHPQAASRLLLSVFCEFVSFQCYQ
jgi:hypothetical protein